MDPRTFLPAAALPLASTPQPGDPAPRLPADLSSRRPAVLAFLRHTGCPFAEATLKVMRDAATEAPEIQWIAISHAREEDTARWCRRLGGSGEVQLVSDPSRRAFAAWGLGRTSIGHFLGRRSLTAAAQQARAGIRNSHPSGTRWQSAGTFALDAEHIVRWRHLPEHAGDLPDIRSAVASVR